MSGVGWFILILNSGSWHRSSTKKTMARVGWNFGELVSVPGAAPMGSAWAATSSETLPPSEGQARIGFVFDEVAESPPHLGTSAKAPAEGYTNDNGSLDPNLLHPADTSACPTSVHKPKRPPPRLHEFFSASCDVPESEKRSLSERPKSLVQSRSSSRNSAAYEQGLAEMADLMTTVDLSESEKQKIRERFALDK
ncbi:hypothetical protein TcWFU_004266 [Taenia crassiceps]|uniref:Uncharacterized protein n=1 Tax=Taenia crassiceps TaxID=6207 RepID=A0ABR4QAY6_9CEST